MVVVFIGNSIGSMTSLETNQAQMVDVHHHQRLVNGNTRL